jgi:hypothetical protein
MTCPVVAGSGCRCVRLEPYHDLHSDGQGCRWWWPSDPVCRNPDIQHLEERHPWQLDWDLR